ncbi:MAG: ROK family transcriptional regulator [Trueperaceae bacterium]|jgi:predicted NBD/HSP70 family sugar kinase
MTPSKATREQLREHNRRLVLRMLYQGEVNTRAALATVTGLTKPTVSSLIGELIDDGLVLEEGLGRSSGSGGKRPTLLAFNPRARHIVGVAVGSRNVSAVLSDLAGVTSAVHVVELNAAGAPAVLGAVEAVVAALLPQLDAPLLAVGVAIPGRVRPGDGSVRHSAALGLHDEPLAATLTKRLGVPVHVGNYAELCALGQYGYGLSEEHSPGTSATMTLDEDLELGVVMHPSGAHFGSELAGPMIDELRLGWSVLKQRAAALLADAPNSQLQGVELRYLAIRRAAADGDEVARALQTDLARALATPLAWVTAVLQPSNVSLAGGVTDLGEGFLELLKHEAARLLGAGVMDDVHLSMAYSHRLGAMGAVALANLSELELVA